MGDAISSTTVLAVKGHAPAHGGEPVSGSHVGRSASGQGLKLLFWHLDNGRENNKKLGKKNHPFVIHILTMESCLLAVFRDCEIGANDVI